MIKYKVIGILSAFMVLVIISCKHNSSTVEGTYKRLIDHEFAKGWDTIQVELLQGNYYRIRKNSFFKKIIDGKAQPMQTNHEDWTGFYDADNRVIIETKHGKVLSFPKDGKSLWLGTTQYKR